MKKLLSILGAVSLTATTASSVVACGARKTKTVMEPPTPVVEPQKEETKESTIDSLTNDKTKLEQELQSKQSTIDSLRDEKNKLEQEPQNIKNSNINLIKYNEEFKKQLENMKKNHKSEINKLKKDLQNKVSKIENLESSTSYEEVQRLRKQIDLQRINISKFNLTPTSFTINEIIVPKNQKDKNNKIVATENDIKNALMIPILKQLQKEVDSSLTGNDFILLIDENDSFNSLGLTYVDLTSPKEIKIKIKGTNRAREETN